MGVVFLELCGKNEVEASLTGCKRSGNFQLALVMLLAAISDAHSGAKRLENTSNAQETNMWLGQSQVLLYKLGKVIHSLKIDNKCMQPFIHYAIQFTIYHDFHCLLSVQLRL